MMPEKKLESSEFSQTRWSLISAARSDSPDGVEAMESLARAYLVPIRAYVASLCGEASADDLVQEFFARKFLRESFLASVRRGTGSFRTYVRLCVRRFVIDQVSPERKRPPPGDAPTDLRLDQPVEETGASSELVSGEPAADLALDRAWLRQLLIQARDRLGEECAKAGKLPIFTEFIRVLDEDPGALSHREIAALTGMSEESVTTAFWRLRERLKVLLNREIRKTVSSPEDWQAERDHLLSLFSSSAPTPRIGREW